MKNLIVILSVAIVILAGSAAAIYYQYTTFQNRLQVEQAQIDSLKAELASVNEMNAKQAGVPVATSVDYCTEAPINTEIGRPQYPIDPKYKALTFLGQLFTAAPCGEARLGQIAGVENGQYTLGSSLAISSNTADLVLVLKSIGYQCDNSATSDDSCLNWTLTKAVPVAELLKLQSFYQLISSDDCVNCG